MADTTTMPLLEVLRGAETYLTARGVEQPRLNAEHLLARALGVKRMELYLQFDRPLGEAIRGPLRESVRRRGTGEPLQHILGDVEFHGRTFACDRRALIPRPETEQLVEWAMETLRTCAAPQPSVLDAGTGSGVIALTLALEFPAASVQATDRSAEALTLAAANAERLGVAGKVQFHLSDLMPPDPGCFHLLAANLPYIPSAEIPALSREVRHDPLAALDGGPDGLEVIRRLIPLAADRLHPGGTVLLEIGLGQAEAVRELLAAADFRDITVRTDYQEKERFVRAHHG